MGSYQNNIKSLFKNEFKEDAYGESAGENAEEKGQSLTQEEKNDLKRFNFPPEVRVTLGARVGFICSCPTCNQVTLGPKGNDGFVILGEAAHIYGATKPKNGKSTRIPRPAIKDEQDEEFIKSLENGIWLCRHHHRLIDAIWSDEEHTPSELIQWKKQAEERQAQDLRVTEHKVIRKFFDRLNDFDCDYVNVNKFKKEDWLVVLYLVNSRYSCDRTIGNYVLWLNSVGIKPSKAGLELNDVWFFKWPQDRLENLTSIVEFSTDDDGLYEGYNFEKLINDLYNMDEEYYELMINELKTKYL